MASYLQQQSFRYFEKIMLRNFFNSFGTEPKNVLYASTGVSCEY